MYLNFLSKIFIKRRSDVSFLIFFKFLSKLIYQKILKEIFRLPTKENSCLILFPPSLGLGDLIILSKILDIVKESNKYKIVSIASAAPYLQKIDQSTQLIKLDNAIELLSYEEFILPSPSLLNYLISFILGLKNCKGYLTNNNSTNLKVIGNYNLKYDDPYYFRLKPFKDYFEFKEDLKPFVWKKKDRENLKFKKSYISINLFSRRDENLLFVSTYKYDSIFRPTFSSIIDVIKEYQKDNQVDKIVIIGSNSQKEMSYNNTLKNILKEYFKYKIVLDFTGKFCIHNTLDLISQSSYFIGANNGLSNIAQMLGIECTLIFKGPEKFSKRKFSEYALFKTDSL